MFSNRYFKKAEALIQAANNLIDAQDRRIKELQEQNIRLAGEKFQLQCKADYLELTDAKAGRLATLTNAAVLAFNSNRHDLGIAIEAQALKLAGGPVERVATS